MIADALSRDPRIMAIRISVPEDPELVRESYEGDERLARLSENCKPEFVIVGKNITIQFREFYTMTVIGFV